MAAVDLLSLSRNLSFFELPSVGIINAWERKDHLVTRKFPRVPTSRINKIPLKGKLEKITTIGSDASSFLISSLWKRLWIVFLFPVQASLEIKVKRSNVRPGIVIFGSLGLYLFEITGNSYFFGFILLVS